MKGNAASKIRTFRSLIALMTVVAVFVSGARTLAASSDVPSTWAQVEVDDARAMGLVIADADSNYQGNISRKLFCALVVNMVETVQRGPVSVTVAKPFEDTDSVDIAKAYRLGIVNGVSATRFAPDDFVTREQIAAMMMRGARKLDELNGADYAAVSDVSTGFADQSDISYWALDDVRIANYLGIMRGVGENRINPKGNTTVEQSILLIKRLYDGFVGHVASQVTPAENWAPEAIADPVELTAEEQTELAVSVSQLATDPDGDELAIVKVNGQAESCGTLHGIVTITTTGECGYISADIATDVADEFVVTVSDGASEVDVNVSVAVAAFPTPVSNTPPTAAADPVEFTVSEQTELVIEASSLATDSDGDSLLVVKVNGQAESCSTPHGTATVTAAGECAYTSADIAANVADEFVVTVSDGVDEADVNVCVDVAFKAVLTLKPLLKSVGVNGTAALDETLTAGMILYTGRAPSPAPHLVYQWMRAVSSDGTYEPIFGATSSSLKIYEPYVGKYLKLKVTASGSATGTATSAAIGPVAFGFADGDGTEGNPYQIASAKQFMILRRISTVGKCFRLTASFSLPPNVYVGKSFNGTLDGRDHTVYVNITDVGVIGGFVGLFANLERGSRVTGLRVQGVINAGVDQAAVGGMAGRNSGSIERCSSGVNVTGGKLTGGLVGVNFGAIERSFANSAYVRGTVLVGGLVGGSAPVPDVSGSGRIAYSYARITTEVGGDDYVGGLIGQNRGSVYGCYSAGHVGCSGSHSGGLIGGHLGSVPISDSYYDKEVSGLSDTGRGLPRTTAEMKTASTYHNWNFSATWGISANQYPQLRNVH